MLRCRGAHASQQGALHLSAGDYPKLSSAPSSISLDLPFFPKMESEIPTLALWPNQPLFAFSSTLGLKLLLICYLFLSDIPRPVRFLLEIDMIKVLSSG